MRSSFFLAAVIALSLLSAPAAAKPAPGDPCTADQTNYTMLSGGVQHDGGVYLLRCNGSAWENFMTWKEGRVGIGHGNPQAQLDVAGGIKIANDSGTCDAAKEGTLRYTGGAPPWEYCDGGDWRPFESAAAPGGGFPGPVGCPEVGDLCADGTVFAGWHPHFYDHLFIPPTDQERPGSPGTFTMQWKNASGTDISPRSFIDGRMNHANRSGNISDFPAFRACEDLNFGGHSDWYLPSQAELIYLFHVKGEIEGSGNITNFDTPNYWTSTEHAFQTARLIGLVSLSGLIATTDKTGTYRVRCMRR